MNLDQEQPRIDDDATIRQFMAPLQAVLARPGVTEVCVNRPGEIAYELDGQWLFEEGIDELSYSHCRSLATAVATWTRQYTNESVPLLGATLPGGERIQFCQPPATNSDIVGICIRKPSTRQLRLEDFERSGLFKRIRPPTNDLRPFERDLLELKDGGHYIEFLRMAVQHRQTILVAGKTGSGKTTFMKALVEEVALTERLITIEDAAELLLRSHRNRLNLFYSKNGQGTSNLTAKQLLEACLRLRPDRIFLAEVRGEEAYYFLRLAASGHPGSITSLHAGSCELAFEQIALMVRESPAGGGMTMPEIKQLAHDVIDIVVHLDDFDGRHITGIHYDPRARLKRGVQ